MSGSVIVPRARPRVLDDLADDLAVELDLAIRAKGLKRKDLQAKLGISKRRLDHFAAYLKGTGDQYGLVPALRAAEQLGIPIAFRIGDEARELAA